MYRTSEARIAKLLNPADPRAFYVAKGATKVADKLSDAVAYVSEREAVVKMEKVMRFYATIFYGKQTKPVANYQYRTRERRDQAVKEYFEGRQKTMAYKAGVQAERKAWQPDFQVGDIFGTCWGYDQTNVEFYELVAIKGKTGTLREIAQERTTEAWETGKTIPLPGKYIGEPFQKRAQQGGFKISKSQWASKESYELKGGVRVYKPRHWSAYA